MDKTINPKAWFLVLPVFLPAEVSFFHRTDTSGIRFDVRDREGVKPHLKGAVKFLD